MTNQEKKYHNFIKTKLSEILSEEELDERIVSLKFKKRFFLFFHNIAVQQRSININAIASLKKIDNVNMQEDINAVADGIKFLHEIINKLQNLLNENENKREDKLISGFLKVYEWLYISYLCHTFIDRVQNTSEQLGKKTIEELFQITKKMLSVVMEEKDIKDEYNI